MKPSRLLLAVLTAFLLVGCFEPTDSRPRSRTDPVVAPSFDEAIVLDATGGTLVWRSSSAEALGTARAVSLKVQLPETGLGVSYLLTNTSELPYYKPSLVQLLARSEAPRTLAQVPARPQSSVVRYHRRERRPLEGLPSGWSHSVGRSAAVAADYVAPQVDDALDFKEDFGDRKVTLVPTHLRYRSPTEVAGRTLNLWVADDCWSVDGTEPGYPNPNPDPDAPTLPWNPPNHLVTQTMVDALAERFLKDGTNDIYGWVTAIYGKEWSDAGQVPESTLIDGHGEVHIFITNLNPGSTEAGGMMGYFWAVNNIDPKAPINDPILSYSNGKILFTLDAGSLANPGTDALWDITDQWPSEALSTLAHEFQHMIHFYQKQATHLIEAETSTWINEMASLVTEDLVAEKLGVPGPRAILGDFSSGSAGNQGGWLPLFNISHDQTALTAWDYEDPYANYASAYAFGAWLLRNYGGPYLLRAIIQNDQVDSRAVVAAVNAVNKDRSGFETQTYRSLVRDWGLACFLESSVAQPYRFGTAENGGQFSWSVPPETFSVGSIDLAKYRFTHTFENGDVYTLDGPFTYLSQYGPLPKEAIVGAGSSFYYDAGVKAGTFQTSLVLPAHVQLTVVVTPQGVASP